MASLSELKTEEELEQWGIKDAIRETEMRRHLPKAAGRFEFITNCNKREVTPCTYSLGKFELTKYVMQLVSRPNTVTLALERVTSMSASTDFRKLIQFIDSYPQPGQSELAALIFPIFVYFHLLLLESGPSGQFDARSFFKKNKSIFEDEKSYAEVLETLYSFNNWKEVKEHGYFKNFLECNYAVQLSPDVLRDLQNFVENDCKGEGDKALLYVLNFHIYFENAGVAKHIKKLTDDVLPPKLERNDDQSIEPEVVKSVSDPVNAELFASQSKDDENEETQLETDSDFYLGSLLAFPFKISDNDDESIEEISESERDELYKELYLNHPNISTIVTKCLKASISSVDLNDDETEIAYALGNNLIYVAPLGIYEGQNKRSLTVDFEEEAVKRLRTEEETMEILPSTTTPQRKGAKCTKTPRNGKTLKPLKSSIKANEVKLNEDETNVNEESFPQVRAMRQIRLPDGDVAYIVKYVPGNPLLLLAVCTDKVRLLNTETEIFEAEFDKHNGSVLDIDVFSSSYFVTANTDTVAYLYTFDWSAEIQTFIGHLNAVTVVKFHPNGFYLATGSEDFTVLLFETESGLCVRRFCGYMSSIVSVAFSPDGKLISAGDSFGAVKVWDIEDASTISGVYFGREVEILGKITVLCFQSDSSIIMACNLKGECKLWDPRNSECVQHLNFSNIPLKAKFSKCGTWKIAFQESPL